MIRSEGLLLFQRKTAKYKSLIFCILMVILISFILSGVFFLRAIAHDGRVELSPEPPIEVRIGLQIEDMVEVDKQEESFTLVGALRMEWSDPRLAFDQEECQCEVKVFTEDDFLQFQTEFENRWPDFTFYNQHGDQYVQNRVVVLEPDGSAMYFERFTARFHGDFDFHRYPFDSQEFVIHIDMLYPDYVFYLSELPSFSSIAEGVGEEEFTLSNLTTHLSSINSSLGVESSRYSVSFKGPRHLEYYIFRIFLPVLGILAIAYAVFFLSDYHKRVELTLVNVMFLITFSFSLADNYPRLGYPTFLDAIMTLTLIINVTIVLISVYMKLLENQNKAEQAGLLDKKLKKLYPLLLVLSLLLIVIVFFLVY